MAMKATIDKRRQERPHPMEAGLSINELHINTEKDDFSIGIF